jgi:hypothetical protein
MKLRDCRFKATIAVAVQELDAMEVAETAAQNSAVTNVTEVEISDGLNHEIHLGVALLTVSYGSKEQIQKIRKAIEQIPGASSSPRTPIDNE